MGLIIDTSVLISAERSRRNAAQVMVTLAGQFLFGRAAISAVSVVELTHGIYRSKSPTIAEARRKFVEDSIEILSVVPLSLSIAALAGRLEGELASKGIAIEFEDLIIGATALHFDYKVATLNAKDFEKIPNLQVVVPRL